MQEKKYLEEGGNGERVFYFTATGISLYGAKQSDLFWRSVGRRQWEGDDPERSTEPGRYHTSTPEMLRKYAETVPSADNQK